MATEHSEIAWTDSTWNPVRGCSIVSAGCTNCYAMKQAHRFSGPGQPYEGLTRLAERGPIWTGKIRLVPEALDQPLRWKKPRRIFVNSMSDLFHEDVPTDFQDRAFAIMALAHEHTFQVLTKRPDAMLRYINSKDPGCLALAAPEKYPCSGAYIEDCDWPLPNVWLGISAEDQKTADERIPILLQTPAAVRFLSLEPLLGPIDIGAAIPSGIGWVIAGGESGPGARPCNIEWLRSLRDQCKAVGVSFFLKQVGGFVVDSDDKDWPPGFKVESLGHESVGHIVLRDRKGGDPLEWPEDLRVREFPT